MKLISLNTFEGHFLEPLLEFVRQAARDTDIFCFQEMTSTAPGGIPKQNSGARSDLLQQLLPILLEFQLRFVPVQDGFGRFQTIEPYIRFGLATLVRKTIPIVKADDFFLCNGYNTFVYEDYGTLGHALSYVQLSVAGKPITVCNVHGISEPGNKLDTPERECQSRKMLDLVKKMPGEKIIVGDFNLLPQTESIRVFDRAGFRNLIREYGITTTRGNLLKQLHPEYAFTAEGFQEFADYAFVSAGIRVADFTVPEVPISDHLPLILTFELPNT